MDILLTTVAVLGTCLFLLFIGFAVMFLTEHINSEHQEHLEDYEKEEK